MGPEYWPLKKQYYERFNALPVPDAPEKLPVLTAEELQTIRTKNGAMCERALQYCAIGGGRGRSRGSSLSDEEDENGWVAATTASSKPREQR
eukprot:SAG25_NODE_1608_length_2687_cov_1.843895_2_plen_92_part_00